MWGILDSRDRLAIAQRYWVAVRHDFVSSHAEGLDDQCKAEAGIYNNLFKPLSGVVVWPICNSQGFCAQMRF
jgi:hypothetical protein